MVGDVHVRRDSSPGKTKKASEKNLSLIKFGFKRTQHSFGKFSFKNKQVDYSQSHKKRTILIAEMDTIV